MSLDALLLLSTFVHLVIAPRVGLLQSGQPQLLFRATDEIGRMLEP